MDIFATFVLKHLLPGFTSYNDQHCLDWKPVYQRLQVVKKYDRWTFLSVCQNIQREVKSLLLTTFPKMVRLCTSSYNYLKPIIFSLCCSWNSWFNKITWDICNLYFFRGWNWLVKCPKFQNKNKQKKNLRFLEGFFRFIYSLIRCLCH